MRVLLGVMLLTLGACASKGAPRVDCRGPLRPVNAALMTPTAKAPIAASAGRTP